MSPVSVLVLVLGLIYRPDKVWSVTSMPKVGVMVVALAVPVVPEGEKFWVIEPVPAVSNTALLAGKVRVVPSSVMPDEVIWPVVEVNLVRALVTWEVNVTPEPPPAPVQLASVLRQKVSSAPTAGIVAVKGEVPADGAVTESLKSLVPSSKYIW